MNSHSDSSCFFKMHRLIICLFLLVTKCYCSSKLDISSCLEFPENLYKLNLSELTNNELQGLETCVIQMFDKNAENCQFCIEIDENTLDDRNHCKCIECLSTILSNHCKDQNFVNDDENDNKSEKRDSDSINDGLVYKILSDESDLQLYRKPLTFELKDYLADIIIIFENVFENYCQKDETLDSRCQKKKVYSTIEIPITTSYDIIIESTTTIPKTNTIHTIIPTIIPTCTGVYSLCSTTVPTTIWKTKSLTSTSTSNHHTKTLVKTYTEIDHTTTITYPKKYYIYKQLTTTETEIDKNVLVKYKQDVVTSTETIVEDIVTTMYVGKKTKTEYNKIIEYTTVPSTETEKSKTTNVLTISKIKTKINKPSTKTIALSTTLTNIVTQVTTQTSVNVKKKKKIAISYSIKPKTRTQFSTILSTVVVTIEI